MSMKKLHSYFVIIIMINIIAISGCEMMRTSSQLTIKDIAFDVNQKSGYIVYIEEGSEFVPYLVLTSDYNGNTLLLRKHVLDEDNLFNDISYSYYKDSFIDRFLNNDFIATLDPEMQNLIVDSEIAITTESSFFNLERSTENITRKVFLLSAFEVGLNLSMVAKEGKPLKYFKDGESRAAYDKNDEVRPWWLRTSYHGQSTGEDGTWLIGEGGIGTGKQVGDPLIRQNMPTSLISGVRPAFCLPNTLLIEKRDGVIDGQRVYVITK